MSDATRFAVMSLQHADVQPDHRRLLIGFVVALLLAAVTVRPVLAGEDIIVDLDISGVFHVDELGAPTNVVLSVNVPPGAVVMGVGWAGTLETIGESWALDADIAIGDQGQDPAVVVTPGAGDDAPTPPGGTFYTSDGIIALGELGLPGFPIASGVIRIEFADSFVDDPGKPEAVWNASSTLSILYRIVEGGECPADLNNDSVVDVSDLLILLGAWGACPRSSGDCTGDLNSDGVVDVSDLLILLGAWGQCPEGVLTGACCFPDGSCQDLTEADCIDADGTYQANHTECASWACEQPPDGSTCDQAIPLEINGPAVGGSTAGNPAPDLPLCGTAGQPGEEGILWFSVVGDGTTLTAETCGSDLDDTHIAIYCAPACHEPDLDCVAGSDEGCDDPFQAKVTWCSAPDQVYYIAVWGQGQNQGEVDVAVTSGGSCSNPMPCALPCDGYCGGASPAGCWCDEWFCGQFGDCCERLCESCPEHSICLGECPPVSCPPGATPEGEPCGEDLNGGCNADPADPPRTPITCGETVCGTLWAANGARDTDWFKLDLTGQSASVEVTFTVTSDIPIEAFIVTDGCPPTVLKEASGCGVSLSACLEPAVYSLIVLPQATSGYPCSAGPFNYSATAICGTACDTGSSCFGRCGGIAPSGCACDDWCHFFNDCCPDVCEHCPNTSGCP